MLGLRAGRHVRLIASEQRRLTTIRSLSTDTSQTQSSSPDLVSLPRSTKASSSHVRTSAISTPRPSLPANFGRNQLLAVSSDVDRDCQRIVASFKAPIRYAFSYGSGVFPQKSYKSTDKPMLDFIFAVSHPSHWHSINLQQNKHHYAAPLRWFGSGPISWLQTSGPGAGVWFNVEVEIDGRRVKYGVTSIDTLCRDLLDWETMYIAGRMHKPVFILRNDERVRLANQVNLTSAIRTALLLLPERFTEYDLFVAIAGLSYRGDFRMTLGENPRKVENIVEVQMNHFRTLYIPLLRALKRHVQYTSGSALGGVPTPLGAEIRTLEQDKSSTSRGEIMRKLPIGLRDKIEEEFKRIGNFQQAMMTQQTFSPQQQQVEGEETGEEEVERWSKLAQHDQCESIVSRSLALIVKRPTFHQSLKGILSAGPLKSIRYIVPKLRKRWEKGSSDAVSNSKPT